MRSRTVGIRRFWSRMKSRITTPAPAAVDRCWSAPIRAARWVATGLLIGGVVAKAIQWEAWFAVIVAGLLTALIPALVTAYAWPVLDRLAPHDAKEVEVWVAVVVCSACLLMSSGAIIAALLRSSLGVFTVGIGVVVLSLAIPKSVRSMQMRCGKMLFS